MYNSWYIFDHHIAEVTNHNKKKSTKLSKTKENLINAKIKNSTGNHNKSEEEYI